MMARPVLEYRRAPAGPRPIGRLLLIGMLTGAVIGGVQAKTWEICWLLAGRPAFLYDDSSEIGLSTLATAFAGLLAGLVYGVALDQIERYSRKRIRPVLALLLLIPIAVAISASMTMYECKIGRQLAGDSLIEHALAFIAGVILSAITSREQALPA